MNHGQGLAALLVLWSFTNEVTPGITGPFSVNTNGGYVTGITAASSWNKRCTATLNELASSSGSGTPFLFSYFFWPIAFYE